MIEDANVDQRKCVLEPSGDGLVRMTWLGDTRGMVVEKDDGGRVDLQRPLNDDPRMDRGAVDGALEQLHRIDHAVAVVQEEAAEHLRFAFGELQAEIGPGIGRTAERPPRTMALFENTQGQGHQRLLLRCTELRRPETGEPVLAVGSVG